MPEQTQTPKCPECGGSMGKAGFTWSGRKKVQRWRCNSCGKTTTKVHFDICKIDQKD